MNKHSLQPIGALLLLIGGLSLSACSNEEMPVDNGRVALQVTSGIQTRAYDNQWEADDRIGIFGHPQDADQTAWSNVQYVTSNGGSNGSFAPAPYETTIYLPVDDSKLDFIAYYPYKADLGNDNIYTVDVTDQSDQGNIDLMAASKQTADRINPKVAFNFVHKLSKIEFTFKAGDGMAAADLAGMKVQLTNQQPKATFDVTKPEGEVSVITGEPATITLLTATDGTSSEGIVLPSANFDDMTLQLELTSGESFNWELSNSTAEKFEAGHKYVYNITVNRSDLGVTSTIADWEEGNGPGGESGNAY